MNQPTQQQQQPVQQQQQPVQQVQHFSGNSGGQLKSKDFAQINVFDGDLNKFPDWADRMAAKLYRAHPRMPALLSWAESQPNPIDQDAEKALQLSETWVAYPEVNLNVIEFSRATFDILMERTGSRLYDKRRNAGQGRGLEYWRILKRDYGTMSTNAQLAKLQLYMKPGRCNSVQHLGEALDKWDALGRDLDRPVPEDFRMLALRELVPKNVIDMMATQVALQNYPEAIMYVRRQVADHRHSHQVQQVQRGSHHGPAPMDVSALVAAVANIRGEWGETPAPTEEEKPGGTSDMEIILAAIKGKGKGKSKSKNQPEDRECYNCGKTGHLARDCWSAPAKPTSQPGAGKPAGKGKGKGKGKAVNNLENEQGAEDEPISIGCLTRAPAEPQLNSMNFEKPEIWEDYVCEEAVVDSGAAECVCGPQHFAGVPTVADTNRASAGVEYVCADGGRIPNLGEKMINGLSEEGQKLAIKFQVTSVNQVLVAVAKLTQAGHDVWFGPNYGVITHGATKRQTTSPKKNGVYVLKIWVPRRTTAALPLAAKSAGNQLAALPLAAKSAGNQQSAAASSSGGTRQ